MAEVEVADLVEKQGAALGGADEAGKGVDRARESAAAVTEELALDQVARHRRAVVGDEWTMFHAAVVVNDPGEDLLAGAGLASDQDRQVGGREADRDLRAARPFVGSGTLRPRRQGAAIAARGFVLHRRSSAAAVR